jgi:hypothetical protein
MAIKTIINFIKYLKMNRFFTLLILLMFGFLSNAQTTVSGDQTGIWTVANSPYQVIGTLTIPTNQTLTIEAGVEVNFQGYYQFIVDGKLLATGTEANIISFTTDNHAIGWGGIRLDETPDISVFYYCNFEYGKTSTGDYPDIHGGAVLLKDANAKFYNCTFAHNDATGDDNGIGGAVYAINTGTSTESLTKFIDCKFIDNHAYGEGGAIRLTNDGHTEISGCQFINNNAGYGGGAIHVFSALDTSITNCLFYQNSANNSGGGAIKTMNPSVTMSFTNCTFAYNNALGAGEGGAIDLSYSDITMVNSIIYQNTQTYGGEINVGFSASAEINFSNLVMPTDATGSDNINTDPIFVDISTGDFHLQSTSPCIDAGIDVGNPFAGTAPDMGCYEYGYGIGVSDFNIDSVALYPNPNKGYFILKSDAALSKIKVFDIVGKLVFTKLIDSRLEKIFIPTLPVGTYYLEIITMSQKSIIKKMIITN